MPRLWGVLEKRKSAREVIALLLPVAVAIAGGIWAVFTYVFPADKPAKVSQPPAVSAGPGGVAAGRDIRGSTISITPSPEAPRR